MTSQSAILENVHGRPALSHDGFDEVGAARRETRPSAILADAILEHSHVSERFRRVEDLAPEAGCWRQALRHRREKVHAKLRAAERRLDAGGFPECPLLCGAASPSRAGRAARW